MPTASRSFISVVSATFQPSPTSPSRWLSGMRTSVKNTSLKLAPPEICLIGRTSTPGLFMTRKNKVRPLCLGDVGIGAGDEDAVVASSARPRSRPSGR